MRRFALVLGLTAALAAATAAPAAAHKITPPSFDFGTVLGDGAATTLFTLTAEGTVLSGSPSVVSGDTGAFKVGNEGNGIPPGSECFGTLPAGESCIFVTVFNPGFDPETYNAVVGVPGGPTATVTGNNINSGPGGSKGKKKSCKKKGKKGAASAKKKKCKKKGKK